MATPSNPQLVDKLTIHKVDSYNTWKTQYNTNIGDDDLIIIPPTCLMPRPVVNNVVSNGTAGQFLQTDGFGGVLWSDVDALPSQTSSTEGKFLKSSLNQQGNYEAIWDALPSNIFVCEYGVTTFSEVETAYQANKMIFVQPTINTSDPNYDAGIAGSIFILSTRCAADDFIFYCVSPWRYGNVETTTSVRCTTVYDMVDNPTGNPSTQGWYILQSNGMYSLTTDTTVVSGRIYYIKSSSTDWSILHLDYGGGQTIYYGTCSTSSATTPKTVSIIQITTSLYYGMMFRILFSYSNTLSNPTLTINNEAYPIRKISGSSPGVCSWQAGEVLDFFFNGNAFILINGSVAGERGIAGGIATLDAYGKVTPTQTTARTISFSSSRTLSNSDNGCRLKATTGGISVFIPSTLSSDFEVEILSNT